MRKCRPAVQFTDSAQGFVYSNVYTNRQEKAALLRKRGQKEKTNEQRERVWDVKRNEKMYETAYCK